METVIMPKELTAENGAKHALIGKFSESYLITCQDCDGEGCWNCDKGSNTEYTEVSWTTIKAIYAMAVEKLSTPTTGEDDDE
jgi:hypothetical protein